jgi:hypothetical protein
MIFKMKTKNLKMIIFLLLMDTEFLSNKTSQINKTNQMNKINNNNKNNYKNKINH